MTQQLKIILTKGAFVIFLLIAASLVQPAVASQAGQSEITPFEAINYFKVRHFNGYSAAVIGFLNPEVELPATVELAIPAGSEVTWFSEVSGGPLASDPEFTEPFNKRVENNFDIYTVTLEHYHSVQIEYRTDLNPVTRLSDGWYSIQMSYTPIADLPILRLMTNLPAETAVQDSDVEFIGTDDEGNPIAFRIYTDVNAFQVVQGEITYFPPAGQGMVAVSGNLWSGLGVALGVTAAVVVTAAGFIFIMQKRKKQ